jgi:hypothetical protein
MTDNTILPYEREGAWFSQHGLYYACAYRSLHSFRVAQSAVTAKEAELLADIDDVPKEFRGSYIQHETSDQHANVEQTFVSAILFACMAIEAFINNYGVRRLGEEYFRKNLERIGITEKFSLLLLACHGLLTEKSDSPLVGLRAMFDTRNQLVHPKAKEFSFELIEQKSREPSIEARISVHFERMEMVIGSLCTLDNHIRRDFEFRKPEGVQNNA